MRECCQREGLGLTCSAEYLGYYVRVIDWNGNGEGKERKGRHKRTEQTLKTMGQITASKKAHH